MVFCLKSFTKLEVCFSFVVDIPVYKLIIFVLKLNNIEPIES